MRFNKLIDTRVISREEQVGVFFKKPIDPGLVGADANIPVDGTVSLA